MKNFNQDYETMQAGQMANGAKNILTGILVGGVIGATAMLFLAPRSGEDTRAEILDKASELRDRTTDTVKDAVSQVKSQVKSKADHVTGGAKGTAHDLKSKGQDALVEQLDRVVEAVEAVKKVVEEL
jgi:gas vesicle protein